MKFKKRNLLFFLLSLFLFIFSFETKTCFGTDNHSSADEPAKRLEEIQKELAEKKARLEEIEQKRKNVLMELLKSKSILKQTEGELEYKRYQLIKSEQKVIHTQRELEEIQRQLKNEWAGFYKRLREIYKNSQSNYLEIIFGARSLADFVSRTFYFEKIIAKDIEILNRIRQQQEQIVQKRKLLEEQTNQIRALTRSIELKKDQLKLEVSEKKKIEDSLQKMKEEYERQIAELEENSRQIEAMLRQADPELTGVVPEATGQFIWPVMGRISSSFGLRRHPIFRIIRPHQGIDIICPYGYPIKAADGGVVIDARYWGGYGNVVILSHGKGISTVYAHLSRFYVVKGQRVQKGQTLGLAGSTGYSTGPHLHFEVRRSGVPVNPMNYLP